MLAGIPLTVSRSACWPKFRRWRRTNRNDRIARKWRKRYGAVVACGGVAFRLAGMGLIVCPCLHTEPPTAPARSAGG